MIPRLRLTCTLLHIRLIARFRGLPDYSNAGITLGFLAHERMRWTRETYVEAARAELPKIQGLFRRRDVRTIERWLERED